MMNNILTYQNGKYDYEDLRKPLNKKIPNDQDWIDYQTKSFDKLLRESFSKETSTFSKNILNQLVELCNAYKGLFFILDDYEQVFELSATYACLSKNLDQTSFELGEGIIGQAALSNKMLYFDQLPAHQAEVEFSSIMVNIDAILVMPLSFNEKVYGVIQLIFLKKPNKRFLQFFEQTHKNIAAMLESIAANQRTQRLLQETQDQKDLLSTQEEELRQNLEELASIQEALVYQNQEIDLAFKELEKNNNRIIESITYAKRIQQAILPSSDRLKQFFTDHFIIYQPKDLVSGDFYWFGQVNSRVYIAVVDCTGHGVPGAFMSMIGNTLLNQIVIEKKVQDPKYILSALHSHIRQALKQETSENKDGMDITLCCLEKQRKSDDFKITFAGAKTSLYFLKSNKLFQLKGDRSSIGGVNSSQKLEFNDQTFHLKKGDSFYLSSDGFRDTCNEKRKNFGTKNLERLIIDNQHLSMEKRGEIFWEELEKFKGEADQRDDITFLGLRL